MANECVVYHKHLAGMDLTDGYIGISKNFEERMKQHHRDAFVKNSIYTVHERMRMHGDEVITSKIFEGSINECFDYEEELRPKWHMGWNMAIGGGRPGSGWRPNPLWMCNRLWHPEYGEEIIHAGNKLIDVTTKYAPEYKYPAGYSGKLGSILYGKVPTSFKWELANAQLAQRVKDRSKQVWDLVHISNGKEKIKVFREGASGFYKYLNIQASEMPIKHLWTGKVTKCSGWELITEEEWLATAERVEFK